MKKLYKFLNLLTAVVVGGFAPAFAQGTVTYNFTGAVQTYTVPLGIRTLVVNAQGATGGDNSDGAIHTRRGYGGCITAKLTVTPGQVLSIFVGGAGGNASLGTAGTGGYNGGGIGGAQTSGFRYAGGGGGGASDIRIGAAALTDRVLVAGGGGGFGRFSAIDDTDRGGDGGINAIGGATGNGETGYSYETGGARPAGGGTGSAGGAAGFCVFTCTGSTASTSGGFGFGGGCSTGAVPLGTTGGGGGGGYYGGGGGHWGGGGGGSNYAGTGTDSITHTRGCNTIGDGNVTITAICSIPGIVGLTDVCLGSSITLSNAVVGGTWSSADPTIATVDSVTGIVTGLTPSASTVINYILGPCSVSMLVNINPLPIPITGTDSVCEGLTTALIGDGDVLGRWFSVPDTLAAIDSVTGIVTGVEAGTSLITYRLPTGCQTTMPFRVNPLPAVITGTDSVCEGLTTVFSSTAGGMWVIDDTSIAVIDTFTGVITARVAGLGLVTYTLPTGCIRTATLTVNPLPADITGTFLVCESLTTTLTNAVLGGSWTSSDTTIAVVNASSGVVRGRSGGIVDITYTLPTGCIKTATVQVDARPSVIGGIDSVCVGLTTTLSNDSTGGIWTTSDACIAVDAATGVVTGISACTATVTYTLISGCLRTRDVRVNPLPLPITGTFNVCQGYTETLTSASAGGTWISSDVAVATIGTAGIYSGITGGTSTITYTLPTGCIAEAIVAVDSLYDITGSTTLCVGYSSTLSDSASGGDWYSSNLSVATVDPTSGEVWGVSFGSSIITYVLPSGCMDTIVVHVNPLSPITGTLEVCEGLTTSLSNITTGGTWASSATACATIDATTGEVFAVLGSGYCETNITYTLGTGCTAMVTVTVHPLPAIITGPSSVCQGQVITLLNDTLGGDWLSSNLAIATVDIITGDVTGTGPGLDTISYVMPTGCMRTTTVFVNPLTPIYGRAEVCLGSTTSLFDTTLGGPGTWTSDDATVADVDAATGVVTGMSVGIAEISYTLPTGCRTTITVTVQPLPAAITGVTAVCMGSSITVTSASAGGTWSVSSAGAVASVTGTTTILVSGVTAGVDTITYTLPTGCIATATVTVNHIYPIMGSTTLCVGTSVTLSDSAAIGGTWTSGSTSIATIGSSDGIVTGVAAGTAAITYTMPTGCTATTTVLVNTLPSAIAGATFQVCSGLTITLTSATGGGTWASSDLSVATITSTSPGIVTGVSAGVVDITYTLGTGCIATTTVLVFTLAPITGPGTVCVGSTISLADTAGAGTGIWTISAGGRAVISSSLADTAVVLGVTAPGTEIISYTLPTGCRATRILTVNPLPLPISGSRVVCPDLVTNLVSVTGGGTWSSSDPAVATVDGSLITGTIPVTGVVTGTATITFTLPTGCLDTFDITVLSRPDAIVVIDTICMNDPFTATSTTPGGTWSSTGTALATIGMSSGAVTTTSGGTILITYTEPVNGCIDTANTFVHQTSPILGTITICQGSTTTLTNAILGGTWVSGNTAVFTIGSTDGVVTGVAVGTAAVTYTNPVGCPVYNVVTITPIPGPITFIAGLSTICQGQTTTVTDAIAGGVWNSSDVFVATVDPTTGIIIGTGGGTATITYSIGLCIETQTVTVNGVAPIGIVSGGSGLFEICDGGTLLLGTTGVGTWSSSDLAVATITSAGLVTAVSPGTTTISYLLGAGCSAIQTVTVHALPDPLTGPTVVCTNGVISLTANPGGGAWSTGSAVATVNATSATTADVSGLPSAGGIAVITYTMPTTCFVTASVTVNREPAPITGTPVMCIGTTTTLNNATAGGSWSSSNTAIATIGNVGPSRGVAGGVALGTSMITYENTTTGCFVTRVVTVNTVPSAITGASVFCAGTNITLSSPTPGGGWSSSNVGIATAAGFGTVGTVGGVLGGTATIIYSLGTGCNATYNVTVLPQPNSVITPLSSTALCPGGFVILTSITGAYTYQWFNAGTPIGGATASTYTALTAAPYTVRITDNATSCSRVSAVTNVTVNPITATIATAGGATTACAGPGLTFNATSIGAVNYQWLRDSIPIPGATSVSYTETASSGNYMVIATNTAGCSDTSNIMAVTILPAPGSTVTADGPLTFCAGDSVVFTAVSGTGYTYQWRNTGGAILGATNRSYTATTPSTYRVDVTNSIGCNTLSGGNVVVVNALPTSTLLATGPTVFCTGGGVGLNSGGGGGLTFQWYRSGTLIPGATNGTYIATTSGNYTYIKTSTLTGCFSNPAPITVTALTTPVIAPLTALSYCWGGSATLSVPVPSAASGSVTYQWYRFGVTIPGAIGNTYVATTPGDYNVEVIATAAACTVTSAPVTITEKPLPNPIVSFDGVNLGTQLYYVSYQWFKNLIPIVGANTASTPSTGDGDYKVAVTDTNGCQSASALYPVRGSRVGITDPVANNIRIFPNPAQTRIFIESDRQLKAVVTSIDGKIMLEQADVQQIDITNLADGVYVIMLYDTAGQLVKAEKMLKTSN